MAQGVTIDGTTAYVADYSHGIQIIDVSNPASPTWISSYNTPTGRANDVTVMGTIAYVAADLHGLQIIDLSDCPPCPADLTDDGSLNFLDISTFLIAFSTTDPAADFNQDASFNFLDISAFLNAFSTGCP